MSATSAAGTNFRWVDTVVELKSIIGSGGNDDSRPAAIVGGYWAVGDGGGGIFYWDRSSSSGDNGVNDEQPGTIIVPTGSTSGRWSRIYNGHINVQWFGARGQDQDIDDAAAINKAISVAGESRGAGGSGGKVFIPRGVYRLHKALNMLFKGVRLHGEGAQVTYLVKFGTCADTIIFNEQSGACEVAQLTILHKIPDDPDLRQTSGAAIRFSAQMGTAFIKLSDLLIEGFFQGIAIEGSGFERGKIISEVAIERIKIFYTKIGIKLCYAVNWTLQNIVVQKMEKSKDVPTDPIPAPGSNVLGVWIDTETEGCIFNGIYSLGGEHCWRIARSINIESEDRAPSENRFYSCIGDNGTVSCIYISSLHRGIFTNCWCSTQSISADAAVVMDNLDIWGVQWMSSQIVNVCGHGIKVAKATSFSIMNSTFSEWNIRDELCSAVLIHPDPRTNFTIIGNQFIRDIDFGEHHNNATITVNPGQYNRYIISNNLSYSGTRRTNLGIGCLEPVVDDGTTAPSKVVTDRDNL